MKACIYFSASKKTGGPAGTCAIVRVRNEDGGISETIINNSHPLISEPQGQLTAVIEGLQALDEQVTSVLLVGTSDYVAGWINGTHKIGSKTRNKSKLQKLFTLVDRFDVKFVKATREPHFVRCKNLAANEAKPPLAIPVLDPARPRQSALVFGGVA
ncbi:MAG: hypothetical protein AAF902_03000 [Chloroflexota bacterium]